MSASTILRLEIAIFIGIPLLAAGLTWLAQVLGERQ